VIEMKVMEIIRTLADYDGGTDVRMEFPDGSCAYDFEIFFDGRYLAFRLKRKN